MNILSIGNSFSQDAHRFLSPLAAASGDEIWAVNLYIGGCSLNTHWENIRLNQAAYQYQKNDDDGQWVYTESTTPPRRSTQTPFAAKGKAERQRSEQHQDSL